MDQNEPQKKPKKYKNPVTIRNTPRIHPNGRPEVDVDWNKLSICCQKGLRLPDCAAILGVSRDSIMRRLRAEQDMTFEEYRDSQMALTRQKLIDKALDMALEIGDKALLIFCLKNFCGWSDKVEHGFDKDKRTIMLRYNLDDSEQEQEQG